MRNAWLTKFSDFLQAACIILFDIFLIRHFRPRMRSISSASGLFLPGLIPTGFEPSWPTTNYSVFSLIETPYLPSSTKTDNLGGEEDCRRGLNRASPQDSWRVFEELVAVSRPPSLLPVTTTDKLSLSTSPSAAPY